MVSLFVDHRDRLWIGTNDSGAAVKEQNEVRMYSKADGLKSLSVRCITEDDHDNIYIGTARGIILIQPDDTIVPLEDETLGEPYVRRMNKGADGLIYGVTQTGSVFALDGDRVVFCHDNDMLNLPHVRSVLPDSSNPGSVYLGTETSEIFYGRMDAERFKTEQIIDVSPVNYVNDIKVYGDQMWISGDNGIGIWKNGVVRLMDSIPMNNSVEHMMSDYSGNLWFTSSRQGVMKIVPNQFADVFERFDLPDVVVNTTRLNNGKLMVGTDKGLTVLEKDRVLKTFPVNRVRTASGKEMEQNDLLELFDSCRILRSVQAAITNVRMEKAIREALKEAIFRGLHRSLR
ncbi:MAG: hypothetical protein IKS32_12260 [Solobacterium sp.]|nr:hypothetical protein [Solobacterium sp.]